VNLLGGLLLVVLIYPLVMLVLWRSYVVLIIEPNMISQQKLQFFLTKRKNRARFTLEADMTCLCCQSEFDNLLFQFVLFFWKVGPISAG